MPISRNRLIAISLGAVVIAIAIAFLLRRHSRSAVDPSGLVFGPSRPVVVRDSSVSLEPPAPPDAAGLAATLRDSSWQARLGAVGALRGRTDIPVARRAEILLQGLAREIAQPTESLPFPGSYLPATSTFRLQFLWGMEWLGRDAIGPARQAAERAGGETREWMLLTQAGAGDIQASPGLRELLRTSRQGPVRMTAARLLGRLRDRSALPDLQAALKDSFTAITEAGDLDVPSHSFYPVREQAAGALQALGVKVERRGNDFVVR